MPVVSKHSGGELHLWAVNQTRAGAAAQMSADLDLRGANLYNLCNFACMDSWKLLFFPVGPAWLALNKTSKLRFCIRLRLSDAVLRCCNAVSQHTASCYTTCKDGTIASCGFCFFIQTAVTHAVILQGERTAALQIHRGTLTNTGNVMQAIPQAWTYDKSR